MMGIETLRQRRANIDERVEQLRPLADSGAKALAAPDLLISTATGLLVAGAIYDIGIAIVQELNRIRRAPR
jgi:hypothetical protein